MPSNDTPAKSPSASARLMRPIRGTLWAACLVQALGAVAGVAPFIAVAELGRVLLGPGPIDASRAWWIAGLGAGALLVRLLCLMIAGGLTHLADLDLQLSLRQQMAGRLGRVPLGWFTEHSAGAVKKALQDDVAALHHVVGHAYTNMTSAIVTPLVALTYLFWADWRLALAALLPVVAGAALYSLQYRGYGDKMADYNRALEGVNTASVEFVQGIAVVKTFGQGRKAYDRFVQRTRDFVVYFWNWVRGLLHVSAVSEIMLSPLFALIVVVGIGLWLVSVGAAQSVDLLPAVVLGPGLTAPFLTLAYSQNDLMLAQEAASRIASLLDTPVLPLPARTETHDDARVVFDGVGFSYDSKVDVLRDVDLVLEPCTVTALVGPSGSGKSTLARLLPRFWDPDRGRITIGGTPVAHMPPETLYRMVSFVFQDVQLLRASIRDNIALADPETPFDVVERAARAARIHERILALPRGYDSVVGEDAHLSGGEAQRVSIARALLADAPIVVLDEATAFADPESEAAIQDAVSTLVVGRTLLVIAHRLHTVTGADQICVVDDGRIVERGTHASLLESSGLYAKLWHASELGLGPSKAAAQ